MFKDVIEINRFIIDRGDDFDCENKDISNSNFVSKFKMVIRNKNDYI